MWYISRWAEKYLRHAQKRLQKHLHGLELSIQDVYIMQQMCAYEVSFYIFQNVLILRPLIDCRSRVLQVL